MLENDDATGLTTDKITDLKKGAGSSDGIVWVHAMLLKLEMLKK